MRANRFSNVASTYDKHADPQRALADSLSIMMPDCNPDKILEIGSGTGILTQLLINTYPVSKIHGIDLSLSMINLCKEKFSNANVSFESSDVLTHSRPNYYDLIVSSSTLHWTNDLLFTLKKIYKNLKPNGFFVLGMMLEGTLHEIRELKKEIAPHKGKGLILPSYNKFNDLILKSKFNILKKNHQEDKFIYPNTHTFIKAIHEQGVTTIPRHDRPLNKTELSKLVNLYEDKYKTNEGIYATYETSCYLLQK
tara:strand:- start:2323 stop:3078 length:756 start_codon:yes stop_codon:yes gene_type:complete